MIANPQHNLAPGVMYVTSPVQKVFGGETREHHARYAMNPEPMNGDHTARIGDRKSAIDILYIDSLWYCS